MSDSIRPLQGWSPGQSTPVATGVMKKMLAEACRTLLQVKHPRSPPSLPEDTGLPTDVARALMQEMEGEALREPPAVRRETLWTPKTKEKGSPQKPEPQPGCSAWNPSPVTSPGGRPAHEGTREGRRPRSVRDDEAADVTITGSGDKRECDSPARPTPQGDRRIGSANRGARRARPVEVSEVAAEPQ